MRLFAPSAPARPKRQAKVSGGRTTRPGSYNAYRNGLGVVARRSLNSRTDAMLADVEARNVAGVRDWATNAPLVMLDALYQTHPMAAQALSNDLALAFGSDDTHIVGVSIDGEGAEQTNPDATAALDALWDSLPPEVGGLIGLQRTIGRQGTVFGLACVEAVPGPAGLAGVYTFDPLSVRFRDTDEGRLLEQRQASEWVELNREQCLASAWDGSYDNPYGGPRCLAFLSEGLQDTSEQRDQGDVVHAVAWPRLSIGFPFEESVKFAQDNFDLLLKGQGPIVDGVQKDKSPVVWAQEQFGELGGLMLGLKADDVFIRPKGAEASILSGAAGLTGLSEILRMRRLRVCQALDQLPSMLGITDGGTQAYASTQWRVYAQKLEALRAYVNAIIVWIANRHLRLLGINATARADVEPIQTSDKLADQQARAIEIQNEQALVTAGYLTRDEASVNLTGSGPVAEPTPTPEPTLPEPKPLPVPAPGATV